LILCWRAFRKAYLQSLIDFGTEPELKFSSLPFVGLQRDAVGVCFAIGAFASRLRGRPRSLERGMLALGPASGRERDGPSEHNNDPN
jgi:hypothetical protein